MVGAYSVFFIWSLLLGFLFFEFEVIGRAHFPEGRFEPVRVTDIFDLA